MTANRKTSAKKQAKSEDKKKSKDKAANHQPVGENVVEEEETLFKTFIEHPMGIAFIMATIGFSSYMAYYFLILQHPEYISQATMGLLSLRPAVRASDPRQMLLIGAMGSGADIVQQGLSTVFGLEVLMERFDAERWFARDGTVSNFLAIRYTPLPDASTNHDYLGIVVNELCLKRNKEAHDAYHPKFYRPHHNCSMFARWSDCYAKECIGTFRDEWACAVRTNPNHNEDDNHKNACASNVAPFARTLHLVRHPVITIQELMAKICPGKAKTPHPAFRQLALPWLMNNETLSSPCLNQVAWYVINFNQIMLKAAANPEEFGNDITMVKYEEMSLCDIVAVAGYDSLDMVLYPPNHATITKICKDTPEYMEVKARQKLPEITTKTDATRILPKFTWAHFRKAGGEALEHALRELCQILGYDTVMLEVEEFEDSIDSSSAASQTSKEATTRKEEVSAENAPQEEETITTEQDEQLPPEDTATANSLHEETPKTQEEEDKEAPPKDTATENTARDDKTTTTTTTTARSTPQHTAPSDTLQEDGQNKASHVADEL